MKKVLAGLVVLAALSGAACSTSGGGSPDGASSSSSSSSSSPSSSSSSPFCSGVLAVGDSITHGSDAIPGWPDQPPAAGRFTNLGVGGATARDLETWTEQGVAACPAGTGPTEIVLAAGINDLAHGFTPTEMEANLTNFVSAIHVPVRLISIQPINGAGPVALREPRRLEYNAWLAQTYPSRFTNCSTPLEGPDGFLNPDYSVDAYVHLTDPGSFILSTCIVAGQ